MGDLFYEVNGKRMSFREMLIRTHISYPSRSRTPINRQIFIQRAKLAVCDARQSTIVQSVCNAQTIPTFRDPNGEIVTKNSTEIVYTLVTFIYTVECTRFLVFSV